MLSGTPIAPGCLHIQGVFTPTECDRIVEDALKWDRKPAEVYNNRPTDDGVDIEIRKGTVYSCPSNSLLNAWWKPKLDQAFIYYQRKEYTQDINWGSPEIQMVEYSDPNDFFKKHSDSYINERHYGQEVRKLSMSLELTNASYYTGCTLRFCRDDGSTVRTDPIQGDAFVFPSWKTHEVTKLESGIRRALIVWYHGPFWR